MAVPAAPTNYYVQTENGQVYLSWNITAGATSYKVYRSTDAVTYSLLASPTTNYYLDTDVVLNTAYFYKILAHNSDGDSIQTNAQGAVPTISGELPLGMIRLMAQQRADRVGSNFVTLPEWNKFINQAMYELYDLLITTYEDYEWTEPVTFVTNGSDFIYDLPNGVTEFTDMDGNPIVSRPIYKLLGIDLGLNTNQNNAYVTVRKFQFLDRNKFVYPNTAGTLYGVFNLQYRMMGTNKLMFIPTPSANQPIRIWYVPRLRALLADTDVSDISISGWIQYVIIRAAKYALDKEESDTNKLDSELLFLKERIENSAANKDQGQPDKIADVRGAGQWGFNWPNDGFKGGF